MFLIQLIISSSLIDHDSDLKNDKLSLFSHKNQIQDKKFKNIVDDRINSLNSESYEKNTKDLGLQSQCSILDRNFYTVLKEHNYIKLEEYEINQQETKVSNFEKIENSRDMDPVKKDNEKNLMWFLTEKSECFSDIDTSFLENSDYFFLDSDFIDYSYEKPIEKFISKYLIKFDIESDLSFEKIKNNFEYNFRSEEKSFYNAEKDKSLIMCKYEQNDLKFLISKTLKKADKYSYTMKKITRCPIKYKKSEKYTQINKLKKRKRKLEGFSRVSETSCQKNSENDHTKILFMNSCEKQNYNKKELCTLDYNPLKKKVKKDFQIDQLQYDKTKINEITQKSDIVIIFFDVNRPESQEFKIENLTANTEKVETVSSEKKNNLIDYSHIITVIIALNNNKSFVNFIKINKYKPKSSKIYKILLNIFNYFEKNEDQTDFYVISELYKLNDFLEYQSKCKNNAFEFLFYLLEKIKNDKKCEKEKVSLPFASHRSNAFKCWKCSAYHIDSSEDITFYIPIHHVKKTNAITKEFSKISLEETLIKEGRQECFPEYYKMLLDKFYIQFSDMIIFVLPRIDNKKDVKTRFQFTIPYEMKFNDQIWYLRSFSCLYENDHKPSFYGTYSVKSEKLFEYYYILDQKILKCERKCSGILDRSKDAHILFYERKLSNNDNED